MKIKKIYLLLSFLFLVPLVLSGCSNRVNTKVWSKSTARYLLLKRANKKFDEAYQNNKDKKNIKINNKIDLIKCKKTSNSKAYCKWKLITLARRNKNGKTQTAKIIGEAYSYFNKGIQKDWYISSTNGTANSLYLLKKGKWVKQDMSGY